jgi:hypothetical protein
MAAMGRGHGVLGLKRRGYADCDSLLSDAGVSSADDASLKKKALDGLFKEANREHEIVGLKCGHRG